MGELGATWLHLEFISLAKWKLMILARFYNGFLHIRFGCTSLILNHVGAIMGLAWEDLGAIWGLVRANLCHVGAILGLSWEILGLLGSTLGS